VACLDGQIHIVDLNGTAERFWPRSVWSPDTWRTGALRGGAALIDIDGDACAEIVQGSDNGTIHVWNGSGEEQAGWPVAFGFGANSSPIVAPFAPAAGSGSSAETFQLLISDQAGFATLILTDWPARELRPGEMWRPDIESGRTRCYPSALIPASQTVSALIDGKSVRFTPNPVVGSQGWLRVRMGRPGTLRLRMRDTSGREVWERLYRPIAGTDGDRLEMDLSDLAPGLYVVQIIAESDGETERLLRKLAIVR
jgi:hypothetical protein